MINLYANLAPSWLPQILPLVTWLPEFFLPEYINEIKGIADGMEIDKDVAIAINFVYELTSFCTSSIAKLTDGTIVHSRNLDFNFPEETKKITYEAHYIKGGKNLFKSI